MLKVGYIGVPGSGKTTTARALAGTIRNHTNLKTVELVAEYARIYIHKYGIDSISDQIRIMHKQIAEENNFPSTIDIMITDSPIFLGLGYAFELRQEGNPKDTLALNDMFVEMNRLNEVPRYDIIFHLPPVLTPVKDGIRPNLHFQKEWREEADKRLLSTFYQFKPRKLVTLNSVDVDTRVTESITHIKNYLQ
jgi:nicotinamide riboside kinase